MSATDTASFRAVRLLTRIGTPPSLARLADAWPLLVIALGGVLSLAWMGLIAWALLELALRLA